MTTSGDSKFEKIINGNGDGIWNKDNSEIQMSVQGNGDLISFEQHGYNFYQTVEILPRLKSRAFF